MTFEEIYEQFKLNPNEPFEIEGLGYPFVFRPTGIDKNVKLIDPSGSYALADAAFAMTLKPETVQKVTLFTQWEKEMSDVLLSVYPDEEREGLEICRQGDEYWLMKEKVFSALLPYPFETIGDGEVWSLQYISEHVEAE